MQKEIQKPDSWLESSIKGLLTIFLMLIFYQFTQNYFPSLQFKKDPPRPPREISLIPHPQAFTFAL